MVSSKDLTHTLRLLLVGQLIVVAATLVEALTRITTPDNARPGDAILVAVTAIVVVVSYAIGVTGLWNKKRWGRLAFSIYALVGLLPYVNDPADETKLSLCLNTLETLLTCAIIGLVFFAMQEAFRGTSKSVGVREVFS